MTLNWNDTVTLPDLELFVDRNYKYDWLSLLGDTEQFVAGGQQWELPNPIEGLALRRGATSVKLVVAHDEYNGVRELQVALDHPVEQRLCSSRLPNYADGQAIQHTQGLTLRSPKRIAGLVKSIFPQRGFRCFPSANALKAVSQVLRYRTNATQDIDSKYAEVIIETCLGIFCSGMKSGGHSFPFRWSSLIIVYMLRRRMFDFDFLNPDQPLARNTKDQFRTAIERYQQGRLHPIGGSVDLPAVLQQMIDYIDRKGSGVIVWPGE